MTKLRIVRTAVAASSALVLSLGVVGIASAQQNNGGWWWGDDDSSYVSGVENDNDVDVKNTNDQHASSGEAVVKYNENGGAAVSGNAANANTTGVTASVTNSGDPIAPSIPMMGDENSFSTELYVDNDSDVEITNHNDQKARTGDAEVRNNGMGGNATSGSAANTNATTVTVTVTN